MEAMSTLGLLLVLLLLLLLGCFVSCGSDGRRRGAFGSLRWSLRGCVQPEFVSEGEKGSVGRGTCSFMTWVLVDWFDLREKRRYSAHIPVVLRVVEVEVEEGEEEAPEACFGTAAAAVAAALATTAGVTELGFSRTAGEGDDDD